MILKIFLGLILSHDVALAGGGSVLNGSSVDLECTNCIGATEIGDGLGLTEIDQTVFQQRVTGTCTGTNFLQSVAEGGTVGCGASSGAAGNTIVGTGVSGRLAVYDSTGSVTSGVYALQTSSMEITGGGGLTLTYGVSAATVVPTSFIRLPAGSVSAPALQSNDSTNNTGLYFTGGGEELDWSLNGVLQWSLSGNMTANANSNIILTGNGTLADPGYTFASDSNSGMRGISSNNISLVTSSRDMLHVTASSITVTPNASSGLSVFYNVSAGSMTVTSGLTGLWAQTTSQINSITPSAVGQMLFCSDCTNPDICVSTGTSIAQFRRIGTTAGCGSGN